MSYFDALESKELKLFYAKLDDLEKHARGGLITHSAFLTPSEAYKAEKYFEAKGNKDKICFFGGYSLAQRKQIFLLPEYIADSVDENDIADALAEDFDNAIRALKITGSGFRALSHRDYLGSILALGIERATVGDICILDDNSAIIFCSSEVESFILFELGAIGRDKVRVERTAVDRNMPSTQKFQAFTDTVASERLDCWWHQFLISRVRGRKISSRVGSLNSITKPPQKSTKKPSREILSPPADMANL